MTAAEGKLAGLADAELPVSELAAVFAHLRRPFAPAAVRWKVQTEWGTGGVVIAYIDARLVIERLNAVCPTMWESRYEAAPDGAMRCHLTLSGLTGFDLDGPRSITRSDVGVGQGTAAMKIKATNSDALKRAAVMFGIGVSIYAMKAVTLKVGAGDGQLRTQRKRKKIGTEFKEVDVCVIDRASEAWLADVYARWLEARGEAMFGPALDHGDEVGAQSMDETTAIAAAQDADAEAGDAGDAEPQILTDDETKRLRMEAEGWYGRLKKVAPRKLPPAQFRQRMDVASTNHEDLRAFVFWLQGLAEEHERAAADA